MDKIRSTDAWRFRATDDPWYAVASHAGKENHQWDQREFYQLGTSDWHDFLSHWQKFADPRGHVLELGCGAGRITQALATHFQQVSATDVSDVMLSLAEKAAPNANFHLVDGVRIPLATDSVDAAFSVHVLQHFEQPSDVQELLCEAKRVIRPGGTIMIHLLVRRAADERLSARAGKVRNDFRRAMGRWRGKPGTVARRYYAEEVRNLLEVSGFTNVRMIEFRVSSNNDPHTFWLGVA